MTATLDAPAVRRRLPPQPEIDRAFKRAQGHWATKDEMVADFVADKTGYHRGYGMGAVTLMDFVIGTLQQAESVNVHKVMRDLEAVVQDRGWRRLRR